MSHFVHRMILVVVFFASLVPTILAQTITFTTFDVPGGNLTIGRRINNAGQIVGEYYDSVGAHGFLLSNSTYNTINAPAGDGFTYAGDIDASGQIIVGSYGRGGVHGFVLQNGVFTTVDPPGSVNGGTNGINNNGVMVGGYNDGTFTHGYIYNGSNFTILNVPGSSAAYAGGNNDAGQVVGTYFTNSTPADFSNPHGFVYANGTYTTFNVPGATGTYPYDINNDGTIVGDFVDDATGDHHFLYKAGIFTTFDVPGTIHSQAFGINDVGVIVGDFTDSTGTHGFIRTAVTNFASFAAKAQVKIGPKLNDDKFAVDSTIQLGAASDGINPLTENVSFQVGTFSTTIPAGSFTVKKGKVMPFVFQGQINGVNLNVTIQLLSGGLFTFKASGDSADLTRTGNPITVKLLIGNDGGGTTAM